ncbi:MAG: HAD family phosphatase [bacterium]|nr:HAD family phosphatase [bacterium]MBU1918828.1 HAD family phosphatase [bacterium]
MFKAVIFDNDGVVINSEPIIFDATYEVFKKYGITITKDDVEEGIGAGDKYVRLPKEKYGLTEVSLEELLKEREQGFRKLAPGRLKPFPGFKQVVNYLKKLKMPIALASSAETEVVYHNLKVAGVNYKIFDEIVDSSKIENKKPAPDIFLQAALQLKVDPQDCLVIEDAIMGIEAAKKANMRVIAFARSISRDKLKTANYVVDSMGELLDLFRHNLSG